jgi:EmrB/QacA subfamily drug resistance transporter
VTVLRDSLRTLVTEPRRPRVVREHPGAWRLALATVCIGAFMGQLDASIVTIALPTVQRDFGVSVGAAAWVGLAYLVTLVSTVAVFGRLSDAVGRKLVYLYGFGVFVAGSAACAVAPSFGALVAFRVLQGLGAAMLQANSVAIVALAVPRGRLVRALGVQGAAQALGLAAGPTVGGALLALGGWRLLFLVNVPTGLVALALGAVLLPRSTELRPAGRLDLAGLALLVPGVAVALSALTLAARLGAAGFVALAAVAAALIVGFVRHERRASAPLLDLSLLATRDVAVGVAGAAGSFVVLFGALVAVPFYLERAAGLSTSAAGALLAVLPVAMGVTAALSGRLADRLSTRRTTSVGMGACAVGLALVGLAHGDLPALAVALGVVGVGLGVFMPANNASVMRAAPRASAGEASGLLNMGRGLGTAGGLGVASLVLTLATSEAVALSITAAALAVVAALVGVLGALPRRGAAHLVAG